MRGRGMQNQGRRDDGHEGGPVPRDSQGRDAQVCNPQERESSMQLAQSDPTRIRPFPGLSSARRPFSESNEPSHSNQRRSPQGSSDPGRGNRGRFSSNRSTQGDSHSGQTSRSEPSQGGIGTSTSSSHLRRIRPNSQASLRVKRNRALILSILVAVAVLLAALLIQTVLRRASQETSLRFVQRGTLYQSVDTKAILIRNEREVLSDRGGFLVPLAGEGAQVPFGARVAMLVSDSGITEESKDASQKLAADQALSLYTEVEQIQKQIAYRQLELVNSGQAAGALTLYQDAETRMLQIVKDWTQSLSQGTLVGADRANLQVRNLMEERNSKIQKLVFEDPTLAELKQTLQRAQDRLSGQAQTCTNPAAGLVSFSTDGWEGALQYSQLESLSSETIQQVFADARAFDSTRGKRDPNQPLFRVVSGLYQAFVFDIPESQVDAVRDLDEVRCYFPDDAMEIERARVVQRIPYEKGVYLVVQTEGGLERFLNQRKLNAQLRTRAETGLMVPSSSLQFAGEDRTQAQLMMVQAGFAHQVQVRVLLYNQDQSIVEPLDESSGLAVGSLVIQNAASVREGDKID